MKDLDRTGLNQTGDLHVRFPLALPCFHRLTGLKRRRATTRVAPEENSHPFGRYQTKL
jgi:hypothetical protein